LRKLVYIEPSPEHPDQDPILERKPDALENSLSALTSIPRYESIREDLQRVMTQNEMRARVNRILEAVMEGDTRGASHGHAPESGDSYLRLRATTAVEEVAKVIAWVLDIDPSSLAFVGIRCLVRAYRNHEYATGATKEYAVRMFLDDFDVSFELRRLRFLLRKLAKLVHYDSSRRSEQSDDEHEILNKEVRATFAAVDLALPTPEEEVSFRPDLFALQAELFGAYSELRRLERRLASKAALVHHRSSDDGAEKLSAAIKSFANESDESGKRALQHVLATDPQRPPDPVLFEKQCLARAEKELEKPAVIAHLEEIADCYKAFIQKQREASARKVTEALHGGSIAAQLLFGMWQRYEDFDRVLFPILYDTDASEGDPIAIVRISPDEASGAGAKQRPVLKGEGFGHFGAFLERSWRRHDILWGRLHAAERIIQMLLPDPADQRLRDQLIGSAHERIRRAVEPELRSSLQLDLQRDERLWRLPGADRELLARVLIEGNGGSNSALLDAYLRSVPSEPDRRRLVELVGRSTIVIGQMIERIAERYHAEGDAPRKWLTRFGRLLIGLAEVASPRSPFEILYKYWLWLAYVFVLVLIGMGALLGKPELVNVALVALAITAFAHFVQWSTYLYFVPLLPWRRFRTVLSLVPVIGIVSLAILALYGLEVEPVVNLVRTGHGALGFLEGVIASHRQNGWSGLELDLLAFCVFAVALVAYAIWLHRRGGSIRAPRWSAAFPDAATSPLFALRFAQSPEEVEALCGPGRVIVPELRRQAQRELGFQALATAVLST
ncbi:MAG TPA: DUF3376 domain-containing protein, partial [Polyangiaceae bacterium]|nr:DUF3376 domain-containing protein [Polyangiaceae bacterium]